MDRLTPLDDLFIELERAELPMHIGSLLIFDGPMPAYEDVLAVMEARLDGIPRYRQRLTEVPLRLGLPVWQDDPYFHLPYHVRHTAVPAPGDDEQVRTLAARLLSQRLDRSRPLWEMWLIEGLSEGRFAVLNKVHHSMVDGISGTDLMEAILDDTPNPPEEPPAPWTPRPQVSGPGLIATGVVDSIRNPLRTLEGIAANLARPRELVVSAARTLAGTVRLGQEMAHVEAHLTGPPSPHRRWDWAQGDLGDVKAIKTVLGGTVNDVILTAITGGFRAFLLHRGVDLADGDAVRTMVPVSMRPKDGPTGGNQVAVMFTDLPVGIADPGRRYHAVLERMADVKGSGLLESTDALIEGAIFVPPLLFAAAGRLAARAPQPMVATITTNVPGPQRQLYLRGRELRTMVPYVPLGMNQLVTVAIISYHGGICCGITADYARVPDVHVLAEGIEAALAELTDLAAPAD